jgi:hypothetical protein
MSGAARIDRRSSPSLRRPSHRSVPEVKVDRPPLKANRLSKLDPVPCLVLIQAPGSISMLRQGAQNRRDLRTTPCRPSVFS